jgi:hypothetical protein
VSREDVSPPIAVPYPPPGLGKGKQAGKRLGVPFPYPGRTVVLPSAGSRGSEDSLPGPGPGPGPRAGPQPRYRLGVPPAPGPGA